MRYEMEADWILLQTCNYRCGYCFFPPEALGEKLRVHATPHKWLSAFEATGRTWLLHITGGEPSIYPEFAELCEALTQRHYISLNSNLTHPSIARFAERIDPARVSFINAGFHFAERERRSGHAAFLTHAAMLQARGFPLFVSLVATPAALAQFEDAAAILRPLGLTPIPKLFRGVHDGREYPAAYSAIDKERFALGAERARNCYGAMLDRLPEKPTVDLLQDEVFLDGEPTYRGQLCDAGSRFVRIEPNGDVQRCGPPYLGNLLAGTFAPMQGAARCNTQFCYYFCEKYTGTARASKAAAAASSPITRFWRRLGSSMRASA